MCHSFVVIWSACADVDDPLLVLAAYRTRCYADEQPLGTDNKKSIIKTLDDEFEHFRGIF